MAHMEVEEGKRESGCSDIGCKCDGVLKMTRLVESEESSKLIVLLRGVKA
mgnify:CR=1 FL=1